MSKILEWQPPNKAPNDLETVQRLDCSYGAAAYMREEVECALSPRRPRIS